MKTNNVKCEVGGRTNRIAYICGACSLIGGYCGNCDGSHWTTNTEIETETEETDMKNLKLFESMLDYAVIVHVGSDWFDPSEFSVRDKDIYLGETPLNVYLISRSEEADNVLILHCESEEWDGANLVFV